MKSFSSNQSAFVALFTLKQDTTQTFSLQFVSLVLYRPSIYPRHRFLIYFPFINLVIHCWNLYRINIFREKPAFDSVQTVIGCGNKVLVKQIIIISAAVA